MKKYLLSISMVLTFITATIIPSSAYALEGGVCDGVDYVVTLPNGSWIIYHDVAQCGGKNESGGMGGS